MKYPCLANGDEKEREALTKSEPSALPAQMEAMGSSAAACTFLKLAGGQKTHPLRKNSSSGYSHSIVSPNQTKPKWPPEHSFTSQI